MARNPVEGSGSGGRAASAPPRGSVLSDVVVRSADASSPGLQLERQVAVMVREGRIGPGRRLPSTRRLASRLGVHRNTVAAAYRRLADRRLLEVRHGARARVPVGARETAVPDRAHGRRPTGVLAAAGDAGSARLMAAELRAALPGSVAVDPLVVPASAEAQPPVGEGGRLLVALPGPAARRSLDGALERGGGWIRARQDSRPEVAGALRRARPLAVVAVLTASRIVREALLCDAARTRGGEVTVHDARSSSAAAGLGRGAPHPRGERAIPAEADLVIADRLAAGAFCDGRRSPAGADVVPLRLLSRGTVDEIARGLGGAGPASGAS